MKITKYRNFQVHLHLNNKNRIDMDYTFIPRELIYRERVSLYEFYKESKLYETVLLNMMKFDIFQTAEKDKLLLTCMNTACYICTLSALDTDFSKLDYSNTWASVREIAFGAISNNQYEFQKIILSLVLVLSPYSNTHTSSLSALLHDITMFLANKYQLNSHDEYNAMLTGTSELTLPEDAFEPLSIIQALEHASGKAISEGYQYVEDRILRIGDSQSQKYLVNLALEKVKWENHTVHWRFECMKGRIGSTSHKAPVLKKTESSTLEEENKKLKEEVNNLKNKMRSIEIAKDSKGLNATDAAILTLTLYNEIGGLPNKRENIWPVMSTIWGFSESTAKAKLRNKVNKESANKLAELFNNHWPKLKRLIIEIPQKLETEKMEKLHENNPQLKKQK